MNQDYFAQVGCTESGMFYGQIKKLIFDNYYVLIGGTQDFTMSGVLHYLHGHGVPYNNITMEQ